MDGEIQNNEKNSRLCLVGDIKEDQGILQAAEIIGVPICISDNYQELKDDETYDTFFVVQEFEGPVFESLYSMNCRILGPTALKELAQKHESLPPPDRPRPTYSLSMRGAVICFTGFRREEQAELCSLAGLAHFMGASIRREMNSKITHLIANRPGGEKYQYAASFNVPIMATSWVTSAWENRHNVGYSSMDSKVISECKLKFGGARVCFMGFRVEEIEEMSQVLINNRGVVSSVDDPECTHLVVDESNVISIPEAPPPKAHIVKSEWFWASVQNEFCENEREYLFEDILDMILSPGKSQYHSTPLSGTVASRARKRKRQQQRAAANQFESPSSNKRRSSISDAGLLSVSGSFLDCTATPEKELNDDEDEECTNVSRPNATGRYQVFHELVQTEANYVGILEMILKLYKTPLEDMAEGSNALLNPHEVKTIFGKLPAIFDIHKAMLAELKSGLDDWKEDFSIGNVIIKYAPEFEKSYPPFINNFEKMKQTLEEFDSNRPRFHAFLKRTQIKSERSRETLKDLLIRPVQRLPSIELLINDLIKRTEKQNPDRSALEQAFTKIRQATTHINEDKRKTEAQLEMFNLFYEIDGCPPHFISSHRNLIAKCECMELTEIVSSKKGDALVILLFTDALELCKKRAKTFHTFGSLKPNSLQKLKKPYKHVRLMPLSNLRKVIDVKDSDERRNMFALQCINHSNKENNNNLQGNNLPNKESLCSFMITDDTVDKSTFLKQICKQMAHTVCTPDPEDFFDNMDSSEIIADVSNVTVKSTHSFSTAFRFASRTGVKVGRALSINKTPNKLMKGMSTAFPLSSQETLTRSANQLARMRLQSCANLSDLACTPPGEFTSPATPMSVQPTRKNMLASAFSVSSLKLL